MIEGYTARDLLITLSRSFGLWTDSGLVMLRDYHLDDHVSESCHHESIQQSLLPSPSPYPCKDSNRWIMSIILVKG